MYARYIDSTEIKKFSQIKEGMQWKWAHDTYLFPIERVYVGRTIYLKLNGKYYLRDSKNNKVLSGLNKEPFTTTKDWELVLI